MARDRKLLTACTAIGALAILPCATLAADGGVTAGAALAKQKCSSCHSIGPGDAGRNAKPVAFADFVAKTPGEVLAAALRATLQKVHSGFTKVSEPEFEAIAAYLESLRTKSR